MRDLQEKVAVVTGGASGIGHAMATRFLEAGMRVVIADVDAEALGQAQAALSEIGRVEAVATDVSDGAAVEALRDRTLDAFGAVHVICNNAGVDSGAPIAEIPVSAWQWVLGVNLWGVIHGIRTFVPHLIAQGEGHVVNTSSVAALTGMPMSAAPYAAAKSAVLGVTRNLRAEMAARGTGVGVTLLTPGPIATNMPDSERNRPADVEVPPASQMRDEVQSFIKELVAREGMDPLAVADLVVAAIRDDRPHVLTHPDYTLQAIDELRAELLGQPAAPGHDAFTSRADAQIDPEGTA